MYEEYCKQTVPMKYFKVNGQKRLSARCICVGFAVDLRELNLPESPCVLTRSPSDSRAVNQRTESDALERCMYAAYKAYLLTAPLKIHLSAGALIRGRTVKQTKSEGRDSGAADEC